jgi:hypothetical protein
MRREPLGHTGITLMLWKEVVRRAGNLKECTCEKWFLFKEFGFLRTAGNYEEAFIWVSSGPFESGSGSIAVTVVPPLLD